MAIQRYKPEQIVTLVRQIEVSIGNGKTTPSLQRSGHHRADFLSLAEGIRRIEVGTSQADEGPGEGEYAIEAVGGGAIAGEASAEGRGLGKLLSPERRRCAVERAREQYGMKERHACRWLGQWRGTQRYEPMQRNDEDALARAIITLATKYGRYGYRRITALLQRAGWRVGKDRVQCIWRREGLKVPAKLKTPRKAVAG